MFKRFISVSVLTAFILSSVLGPNCAYAQAFDLPAPGTLVGASEAYVPVIIKGLSVKPENPMLFDFLVDTGDTGLKAGKDDAVIRAESQKLIKYFMASLTLPEKAQWVNLSPYEKDRMMPSELEKTGLGRDMLAEDYILKQVTASLIHPDKDLGKQFWAKVYAQAQEKFGTTEIPVDTFNKVWVTADKADVYVHNNTAFVVGSHLKVMLESDYLAAQQAQGTGHGAQEAPVPSSAQNVAKQVVREIVLPALETEVNTGKNFANLRQIFHSMILATWYKQNLKAALLNQVYSNKAKTNGVELDAAASNLDPQAIYGKYVEAYKKGVFNFIKEDTTVSGETLPRKYFSGGVTDLAMAHVVTADNPGVQGFASQNTLRVTVVLRDIAAAAKEVLRSAVQPSLKVLIITSYMDLVHYGPHDYIVRKIKFITDKQKDALRVALPKYREFLLQRIAEKSSRDFERTGSAPAFRERTRYDDLLDKSFELGRLLDAAMTVESIGNAWSMLTQTFRDSSVFQEVNEQGRPIFSFGVIPAHTERLRSRLNLAKLPFTAVAWGAGGGDLDAFRFDLRKLTQIQVTQLVNVLEDFEQNPDASGVVAEQGQPRFVPEVLDVDIKQQPLLQFYTGQKKDHRDRSISDIWAFDYETLENKHDIVQMMFPSNRLGNFFQAWVMGVPQNKIIWPQLQSKDIEIFRGVTVTGRRLRANMLRSFETMLGFYGFRYDLSNPNKVTIERGGNFEQRRKVWLNKGNHNFLRIDRILNSLKMVGLEKYAAIFFNALKKLHDEYANVIDASDSFSFWKNSVQGIDLKGNLTVAEHQGNVNPDAAMATGVVQSPATNQSVLPRLKNDLQNRLGGQLTNNEEYIAFSDGQHVQKFHIDQLSDTALEMSAGLSKGVLKGNSLRVDLVFDWDISQDIAGILIASFIKQKRIMGLTGVVSANDFTLTYQGSRDWLLTYADLFGRWLNQNADDVVKLKTFLQEDRLKAVHEATTAIPEFGVTDFAYDAAMTDNPAARVSFSQIMQVLHPSALYGSNLHASGPGMTITLNLSNGGSRTFSTDLQDRGKLLPAPQIRGLNKAQFLMDHPDEFASVRSISVKYSLPSGVAWQSGQEFVRAFLKAHPEFKLSEFRKSPEPPTGPAVQNMSVDLTLSVDRAMRVDERAGTATVANVALSLTAARQAMAKIQPEVRNITLSPDEVVLRLVPGYAALTPETGEIVDTLIRKGFFQGQEQYQLPGSGKTFRLYGSGQDLVIDAVALKTSSIGAATDFNLVAGELRNYLAPLSLSQPRASLFPLGTLPSSDLAMKGAFQNPRESRETLAAFLKDRVLAGIDDNFLEGVTNGRTAEWLKDFPSQVIAEFKYSAKTMAILKAVAAERPGLVLAVGDIKDYKQAMEAIDGGAAILDFAPSATAVDIRLMRHYSISKMQPVFILAEVNTDQADLLEAARAAARSGADAIKFKPFMSNKDRLAAIMAQVRKEFPLLLILGAGGIKSDNLAAAYSAGLDAVGSGLDNAYDVRSLAEARDSVTQTRAPERDAAMAKPIAAKEAASNIAAEVAVMRSSFEMARNLNVQASRGRWAQGYPIALPQVYPPSVAVVYNRKVIHNKTVDNFSLDGLNAAFRREHITDDRQLRVTRSGHTFYITDAAMTAELGTMVLAGQRVQAQWAHGLLTALNLDLEFAETGSGNEITLDMLQNSLPPWNAPYSRYVLRLTRDILLDALEAYLKAQGLSVKFSGRGSDATASMSWTGGRSVVLDKVNSWVEREIMVAQKAQSYKAISAAVQLPLTNVSAATSIQQEVRAATGVTTLRVKSREVSLSNSKQVWVWLQDNDLIGVVGPFFYVIRMKDGKFNVSVWAIRKNKDLKLIPDDILPKVAVPKGQPQGKLAPRIDSITGDLIVGGERIQFQKLARKMKIPADAAMTDIGRALQFLRFTKTQGVEEKTVDDLTRSLETEFKGEFAGQGELFQFAGAETYHVGQIVNSLGEMMAELEQGSDVGTTRKVRMQFSDDIVPRPLVMLLTRAAINEAAGVTVNPTGDGFEISANNVLALHSASLDFMAWMRRMFDEILERGNQLWGGQDAAMKAGSIGLVSLALMAASSDTHDILRYLGTHPTLEDLSVAVWGAGALALTIAAAVAFRNAVRSKDRTDAAMARSAMVALGGQAVSPEHMRNLVRAAKDALKGEVRNSARAGWKELSLNDLGGKGETLQTAEGIETFDSRELFGAALEQQLNVIDGVEFKFWQNGERGQEKYFIGWQEGATSSTQAVLNKVSAWLDKKDREAIDAAMADRRDSLGLARNYLQRAAGPIAEIKKTGNRTPELEKQLLDDVLLAADALEAVATPGAQDLASRLRSMQVDAFFAEGFWDETRKALAAVAVELLDAAMGDASARSALLSGKKVLLVEDTDHYIEMLSRQLEAMGLTVVVAPTLLKALDALDANPDISIVLSDGMFPQMTVEDVRDRVDTSRLAPLDIRPKHEGVAFVREVRRRQQAGTLPSNIAILMETNAASDEMYALNVPVLDKLDIGRSDVLAREVEREYRKVMGSDSSQAPGGIDMNAQNMQMNEQGQKVDMQFDPAMIEQFKNGDFTGLTPVILNITPIANIKPLLGLAPESVGNEPADTAAIGEAVRRESES